MKWSVTRRLAIFILTWRSPLHNNNARHSLLSCDFFQWVQSDSVMDFLCSGIFNYPCRSCFSWTGRCSETMLQSWVHKNRNHKAKENIAFLLYRQCDLLSGGAVWLCIDTFFIQKIDRRLICPQWDILFILYKFISPSCSLPRVRPLWATTQNCEDEMKVKDFSTIKTADIADYGKENLVFEMAWNEKYTLLFLNTKFNRIKERSRSFTTWVSCFVHVSQVVF